MNEMYQCGKKKLRTHQNTKKQSNWMQLLKMENDKLPKEICTYKVKKKHIFWKEFILYSITKTIR